MIKRKLELTFMLEIPIKPKNGKPGNIWRKYFVTHAPLLGQVNALPSEQAMEGQCIDTRILVDIGSYKANVPRYEFTTGDIQEAARVMFDRSISREDREEIMRLKMDAIDNPTLMKMNKRQYLPLNAVYVRTLGKGAGWAYKLSYNSADIKCESELSDITLKKKYPNGDDWKKAKVELEEYLDRKGDCKAVEIDMGEISEDDKYMPLGCRVVEINEGTDERIPVEVITEQLHERQGEVQNSAVNYLDKLMSSVDKHKSSKEYLVELMQKRGGVTREQRLKKAKNNKRNTGTVSPALQAILNQA